MLDDNRLIKIGEAAKMLNVSRQTLRRWDESDKLKPVRIKNNGYRYYKLSDIELITMDIFSLAKKWVLDAAANNSANQFFCQDGYTFQARLNRLEETLQTIPKLKNDFSLISSMLGEIGNNSFDHNLGSWPNVRGIFFAYDLNKRQIVLADRGQGILTTLKRVRPNLKNDSEALVTAFTEKVSGRSPENRGNGLKYVKKILIATKKEMPLKLYFQSGNAFTILSDERNYLKVEQSNTSIKGCLALINF
jgi:hypothetical protein